MKILFLVSLCKTASGNIYGGAEKTIINLANWLAEKNDNNIYLVSVQGTEKPFEINPKINYKGYEIKNSSKLKLNYNIFINIKSSIRAVSPDIIITFEIYPLLYTILNTIGNRGIKVFYSERNDPKIHYSSLQRMIRNIALCFTSGVVFQTKEAMDYFPSWIRNKGIVIHNPVYISFDKYPLISKSDNRIVAVGRLVEQKNYNLLIDAFGVISNSFPELILEIYGEGYERHALQTKINNTGLEKKIFLKGAHKNVIDLIYGARLFIMSSKYEGMPNALMEAMCLGIPVICSDCPCGGPRELINSGENGFLFENNSVEDLVRKIKICLSANISKIRENERKLCLTHSVDNIFNKWNKFIRSKIR